VDAISNREGRVFKCPRCGQEVEKDGLYLPFCSERCRMIDLGTWLEEGFTINGEDGNDN